MRMRAQHLALATLFFLFSLARSPGAVAATACPDGRFPLAGVSPLTKSGDTDSVVLERGLLRIDDVCPPVAGHVHVSRRATRMRARWDACPGVAGRVVLRARLVAPGCDRLQGVIAVACSPRRRFDVARGGFVYDVPLDPMSPWPKFRRDSRQNGRSPIRPAASGGHLWVFATGKGIFSSPVVDGAGNVYIGSADRT